jgi:hypothetical protein
MAVAKSIEPTTESSASNGAQTPETPPRLRPIRSFTISFGERGPRLRMEGRWLREAGFETGVRAKVLVMPGWLLVEALPAPQSTVVPEPKRPRSWAHKNPSFRPVDLDSTQLPPLEVRSPPRASEQRQPYLEGKPIERREK